MVHGSAKEQQHIIGVFTKQELKKCQAMKRQYLQQIQAWQSQFEKKYQRKPKPVDRPGGIVRLQGRCQALNERMQELNDRLTVAHGSIYEMISDKEARTSDTSSHIIPAQSDSFESGGKRSPAQKAFLNRFGSSQ
ncbi:Serine/threonine protein kinase [Phytophthora megakarya]|uniref:Serine/threonine protein kinase n=1 Tax=Phytophthora megakarya TaxID=4795 RepID=A0A225WZR8_9STRA|nr:Serine/threonine protein kinase [Phytophthora megakarya]